MSNHVTCKVTSKYEHGFLLKKITFCAKKKILKNCQEEKCQHSLEMNGLSLKQDMFVKLDVQI